ncbi:hypothetical protein TNCV_562751 [Trichonephila clavipes]|nr:hypothetical protein TNCV_562751 [Trichonephila clavipes]
MENTTVWLFTKELTNTPNRKRIHEGKEQSCRKQVQCCEELFQSEVAVVESETVKSQDSNSNVEPSVAFSEDKKNAELIIEDDSSYIGQACIPAKETVIPTSWNETSGKNTSAVSSNIQEKVLRQLTFSMQ